MHLFAVVYDFFEDDEQAAAGSLDNCCALFATPEAAMTNAQELTDQLPEGKGATVHVVSCDMDKLRDVLTFEGEMILVDEDDLPVEDYHLDEFLNLVPGLPPETDA